MLIAIVARLPFIQAAVEQLSRLHPAVGLACMEELCCTEQQFCIRGLFEAQYMDEAVE